MVRAKRHYSWILYEAVMNLRCLWRLMIQSTRGENHNLYHCSSSPFIYTDVALSPSLTAKDVRISELIQPHGSKANQPLAVSWPSGNKMLIGAGRWILWQKHEVRVTVITCQYPSCHKVMVEKWQESEPFLEKKNSSVQLAYDSFVSEKLRMPSLF